jgi:sialic acid synthase SpsE
LGVPIILSSGMGDLSEIKRAILILNEAGCENIIVLHCVSMYPTGFEHLNLANISGFKKVLPNTVIGFSDHTLGTSASIAATALGASVIEKHFTLDKSRIGFDNNMALEQEEFHKMVVECRKVFLGIGSHDRVVGEAELVQRTKMRRSMVASRDIEEGELLSTEMLDFKRPGNGISPANVSEYLGLKTNRFIRKGFLIYPQDLT